MVLTWTVIITKCCQTICKLVGTKLLLNLRFKICYQILEITHVFLSKLNGISMHTMMYSLLQGILEGFLLRILLHTYIRGSIHMNYEFPIESLLFNMYIYIIVLILLN